MNPYQKLLSNTVLFGLSTFGARFLNFLLTPFYTRILSSAEYGVTDLLIQTGNLIIPIASVSIANAVIRYGLEDTEDKSGVFTTGLLVNLTGFFVLLLVSPLLGRIEFLSGYVWLVLLYVLAANVHSVCNQFARTMGHVRLFALDGILRTVLAIVFNILLLAVFPLGITGYVLASVLADAFTTVFVFLRAKEWRYLRLSALSGGMAGRMLRYSAPLVPSSLCSWIINISDRYLIALLVGNAANGIYAVSNKIPTVLFTVANTFSSAWQISALDKQSRAEKERFFSNVFAVYTAIAFVGLALLLWPADGTGDNNTPAATEQRQQYAYDLESLEEKLANTLSQVEGAGRTQVVLTLATTFGCLGSFLASIYMVEQRSGATLATTMLGAAANVVGNCFLIQLWGSMGAALSTLASYFLILAVRAVHTRSMLRMHWDLPRFVTCVLLLAVQCAVMEWAPPLWPVWSAVCFCAVAAANIRPLLKAARRAL